MSTSKNNIPKPKTYFRISKPNSAKIIEGDCISAMDMLIKKGVKFDMIFADPPYFLSNGGITCQSGKMVKVDKGDWDKSRGIELNHEFNIEWLSRCKDLLSESGTIWVSGTMHIIYSVGYAMQQLDMKLLNNITWQKPNPPPNLSGRYFTHSTETVLWAGKDSKSKHYFNYQKMKKENSNKQMKDVWTFTSARKSEKSEGRHPTQKPLALLERIITASTDKGGIILDPFLGSGTTSVSAMLNGRNSIGIEQNKEFCSLAKKRIKLVQKNLLKQNE